MNREYFIFFHDENAYWGMEGPFTSEEVSDRLSKKHYGELEIKKDVEDLDEGHTGIVVIKGEIVVPKAVETVTKYKLT